MVKCNLGSVEFKESINIICAEVSTILMSLRNFLSDKIGEEKAEKMFDEVVESSKKSKDEIDKELVDTMKELEDLLKIIKKGLLND